LTILLAMFAIGGVYAQDDEPDTSDDAEAEESATPPSEEVTDEEIEELLGLDEDYTEIEDDDFDPTEEVRFEQSINFPVDI
jgi:hypothetical protein